MTSSRDAETQLNDEDAPEELRALAGLIPVESTEHVEARRSRLVQAMEREVREGTRKVARARLVRRSLVAAGGLAAAVAIGFFASRFTAESVPPRTVAVLEETRALVLEARGVSHTSSEPTASLAVGDAVAERKSLLTGENAGLTLELPGSTRAEMAALTSVELTRTGLKDQAFFLRRGVLSVDVPHPPGVAERRVEVRTPEARVLVRGTRFGVEVGSSSETKREFTRVWVERGSVSVFAFGKEHVLSPGESWRSDALGRVGVPGSVEAPKGASERSSLSGPLNLNEAHRAPPTESPTTAELKNTASVSSLEEQNTLLEQALVLSRRGENKKALERLDELLVRYPGSPLAAAARAEQRRLRQALDSDE